MQAKWVLITLCGLIIYVEAEVLSEWTNFKSSYGKSYGSPTEEQLRKYIFLDNQKFVEQHNQKFQDGFIEFDLEVSKFGDMLHSEFIGLYTGYLGVRADDTDANDLKTTFDARAIGLQTIDWRTKGYVTPVKDQGSCGSCWAFSTTGALEGQTFRKTRMLVDLSEQNLIDCTWLAPYDNYGCNGGWMDAAFKYVKENNGLDREDTYLYEGRDGVCRFNASNVAATVSGYVDIKSGSDEALQNALLLNGPISVAIDASDRALQFYKSGIYSCPRCSRIHLNHAVLTVGVTENAWIVKNSWGVGWGDKGYVYMSKKQVNICGISTTASYPLVS